MLEGVLCVLTHLKAPLYLFAKKIQNLCGDSSKVKNLQMAFAGEAHIEIPIIYTLYNNQARDWQNIPNKYLRSIDHHL